MKIESPEKEAIRLAKEYEERKGNTIKDVQKKGNDGKKYIGCDLVSINKEGKETTIEVKGATRYQGIPDPYFTEFSKDKEMVADYMYVFYFPKDEDEPKQGTKVRFYKIARGDIKPEEIEPKWGWRIKRIFKRRMEKFKEDFFV